VLIGDGWSKPCSGRFIPEKDPLYPFCRNLDGPRGWSGQVQKSRPPLLGFEPQTAQNVASRYGDYAILPARVYVNILYYTGRSFHSGNVRRGKDDFFSLTNDHSACCVVVSPPLSQVKKKNKLFKLIAEKELYFAPSRRTYVIYEDYFELSIHL
jgi:hypothetical protein